MARRKKNLTPEEELLQLEQEIEQCESEIAKLSDRKKELRRLIEQKQLEALHQAVQKSGKTINEAIALINGDSQAEEGQE